MKARRGLRVSPLKIRQYWTSKLWEHLRSPSVIEGIELSPEGEPIFLTREWQEYWPGIGSAEDEREGLHHLEINWRAYVESAFSLESAQDYCRSFFRLLELSLDHGNYELIKRMASFENFYLAGAASSCPAAALTTNFRNPMFLFLSLSGSRKHDKQDSRLLPIITATFKGEAFLFYCLTKERLIKHSDFNLLVYLNSRPEERSSGFDFLHALEGVFFSEWNQYLDQRAHRIAAKVVLPMLEKDFQGRPRREPLKILDVGSSDGHLLSNILTEIAKGLNDGTPFHATLLDGLFMDPKTYVQTPVLLSRLSQMDYIRADYRRCLDALGEADGRFDFIFLFKILHNMSKFGISSGRSPALSPGPIPEWSNYHQGQLIAGNPGRALGPPKDQQWFGPQRKLNLEALQTVSGASLFERLVQLADRTLIEDYDLAPEEIMDHLKTQKTKSALFIKDLSKSLGLRTNHLYCVCASSRHLPDQGVLIWPN
jgi:hypothetical protein